VRISELQNELFALLCCGVSAGMQCWQNGRRENR
jgi:hypothetical protein